MKTKLIMVTNSLNNPENIWFKDRLHYLDWIEKEIYIFTPDFLEEKNWKLFIESPKMKRHLKQLEELQKNNERKNFEILNWDITDFIKNVDNTYIFYIMHYWESFDKTIKLFKKYNKYAMIKNYWIAEVNNKANNDILFKKFKDNNQHIKTIKHMSNTIITNKKQFDFNKEKWKVIKIVNWNQWDWVYLINEENEDIINELFKDNEKLIIQNNIKNDGSFRFAFSYNSISKQGFFFIYRRNKSEDKFLDNVHKWNDDISFIWHIQFKIDKDKIIFDKNKMKLNDKLFKTDKYEKVKNTLWFKKYEDILLNICNELTQFILDYNKQVNTEKQYFLVIWFDIFIEKQWVYLVETNLFPWTKWVKKYWYNFYGLI